MNFQINTFMAQFFLAKIIVINYIRRKTCKKFPNGTRKDELKAQIDTFKANTRMTDSRDVV